ncbi:ATP cone domain-containing protein [Methanotorris formicicus]|uniref:ATP-cone domain protein n=1 Tax=Methanotorris formicicus Mc-S-70 TaxID=647171 RepID=H1L053_9EURY|nr:ATP cone domain-containing protein [Methanotorris formicicus]EHP85187.1 ATP-cone domain protein [Methanotorris formicicus Mc-S-70]
MDEVLAKVYITKNDGSREKFDFDVVRESLRNAGADGELVEEVIKRIENRIHDEITTRELKMMITTVLRRLNREVAKQYVQNHS